MSADPGTELRRALPADPPSDSGATVRVAGVTVVIRTGEDAVMEWARHYLSGFWEVRAGPARRADAEVVAVADQRARIRLCALAGGARTGPVPGRPGGEAERVRLFMGASGLRLTDGQRVLAASEEASTAFVRDGSRITVVADNGPALGLATARIVRALAGALLEARGFVLVHAAGATLAGGAMLAFGVKGAGKTAALLSLATRLNWAVCAHDRCYVGILDGRPCALPWPSSLNIGVGLAGALGWAEQLRARYRDGLRPPYHQADAVTAAVLAGSSVPVYANGRELKIQLLPSQVTAWFGVELAHRARLTAVLFPRLDLTGEQVRARPLRAAPFTARDVFPPADGPDHYPDFLRLSPGTPAARAGHALTTLRELADGIPAYRVLLGRDLQANATVLAGLGELAAGANGRPRSGRTGPSG